MCEYQFPPRKLLSLMKVRLCKAYTKLPSIISYSNDANITRRKLLVHFICIQVSYLKLSINCVFVFSHNRFAFNEVCNKDFPTPAPMRTARIRIAFHPKLTLLETRNPFRWNNCP